MNGPAPARLLVDEHAVLLERVATLTAETLAVLNRGRWPRPELRRLLDYLRHELLGQAVQEERLLFPLAGSCSDDRISPLLADHAALRDAVEQLAELSTGEPPDADRLVDVVRHLRRLLERHVVREERALATVTLDGVGARPRSPSSQARRPHSDAAGDLSHGAPGERHRLADEHAVLHREVLCRADAVRSALDAGRGPAPELRDLVDYLRYEVLDQAVTEERLLFPTAGAGFADPRIRHLVAEHVQLRDLTDQLADASTSASSRRDAEALAQTLDGLVELLDRHMSAEQAALSSARFDGVESVRQPFRCHRWFPLTEGPLLDLDLLSPGFARRAALERFARLRPGESLEVCSSTALDGLWTMLASRWPAEYEWVCVEEGPDRWQAHVTRRAAHDS